MPPTSLPRRTSALSTPTPSTIFAHPTRTLRARSPSVTVDEDTVATSSCCHTTPTAVVLDLHTRVVIPNYQLYYSAPISSFRPTYHALGDGSLVATPLIADIRSANIQLALMSALSMFFLVTTFISLQYLRRGKIKKKLLFYILLTSQSLGLVSSVMLIIPFFNQFINCTRVGYVVITGAMVSYSLLMTGILGIKAYRCLNNSRFVLLVLAILRTAMLILMVLDLTSYKALRRLSGSCMPAMNFNIMPVIIILQSAESAFICLCFLVAVWRSSRTSNEQGRMSLNLSLDKTSSVLVERDVADEDGPARRGWWDYVPEPPRQEVPRRSTGHSGSSSDHSGFMHYVGAKWHDLWSYPAVDTLSLHRKPSILGDQPLRQPPRTSVTFTNGRPGRPCRTSTRLGEHSLGVSPPSPSTMSRLSKYMPRMQLFRQVLKNELYYTALVTIIYVVLAILMLIGMSGRFGMNPIGWVALSWFAVSIFTMHSFSRVVRRHERDAILQHPTAWDPVYRAELEASRALNRGRGARRAYSPVSVASRRSRRKRPLDPFEDPRIDEAEGGAESLAIPETSTGEGAGHPLGMRPAWVSASCDFSVSSRTSYDASSEVQADRMYSYSHWGDTEVLPSPAPSDYPCPQSTSACPSSPLGSDVEDKSMVQPMTAPADVTAHSSKRSRHFLSSRAVR